MCVCMYFGQRGVHKKREYMHAYKNGSWFGLGLFEIHYYVQFVWHVIFNVVWRIAGRIWCIYSYEHLRLPDFERDLYTFAQ